jgi:glyoxylase-like metal-dependent hydrolase (beta-lactamase superfamily II)
MEDQKKRGNRVMKIADNVYHVHESSNVYCTLVIGTEKALLIDTGFGYGTSFHRTRAYRPPYHGRITLMVTSITCR